MDIRDESKASTGEGHWPPEALPAASNELVGMLEGLTEVFFTLDRQWRFAWLNDAAADYLGRTRAELFGKAFWDECPHLRGTAYEAQLQRAAEQREACSFDLYDPARKRWKEMHVFPSERGLAVSCIDISERRERQKAERNNALRFQVVARATTDVIFDWDVAADRVWWSDGLRSVFGYEAGEVPRTFQGWVDLLHPDDRQRAHDSFCAALYGSSGKWTGEYRFRRKDGAYADVRSNTIIARDRNGVGVRAIGAMIDISEETRAEAERCRREAQIELQASLLDKAHDAIPVTGVDGQIVYWNRGAERLFGWSAQEALGRLKSELAGTDTSHAYRAVLEQGEWIGEFTKQRKDGGPVVVTSHLTLVRDDDGKPQAVLEIETDITERKQAEQQVLKLAFFDSLTHLPNRRLLLDRMAHALAGCARSGRSGALLFLDLDNFKHMRALKSRGISFALDDFGTGYSSLAYLKRLPLDQLKIDQSFVRDVLTDPNDATIARTILGLGQTLGLDVIAEGVETERQRDFLAAYGCRSFQGYYFGQPVEAEML